MKKKVKVEEKLTKDEILGFINDNLIKTIKGEKVLDLSILNEGDYSFLDINLSNVDCINYINLDNSEINKISIVGGSVDVMDDGKGGSFMTEEEKEHDRDYWLDEGRYGDDYY